ncbi:uncharacterized protein [Clytia hemisphaerica]|uniref:BTB domain-containing protein n=2 Tax=Clytia hemisphaerica TaxID=252671 RepID=A0A7M5UCK3_9CNID
MTERPFSKPWQNSDAVLIVEDRELHVHSMILSLASPVFDSMFNGSFKEAESKRVELAGKSYDLLEHLLKIIYPNFECGLEIKTDLCGNCYPEFSNSKTTLSCIECRKNQGTRPFCGTCRSPGAEQCPKCKQYFKRSDRRRFQHLENLEKLYQLSQEYLIETLRQKIHREFVQLSQALDSTDKNYAMELLISAERLDCQEAVANCSRYVTRNTESYGIDEICSPIGNLKDLMNGKGVSSQTRIKLKGLMVEKRLSEIKEYCNNTFWNKPNNEIDRYKLNDAIKDLHIIAKDMTMFEIEDE